MRTAAEAPEEEEEEGEGEGAPRMSVDTSDAVRGVDVDVVVLCIYACVT
jgi:hypothetical protein